MRNVYKIEATRITGCLAHDFIRKQFRSIKSAVAAFDAIYDRKGFRIVVWKQIIEKDGDYSCVEYICAKIVKSTFR